jgi:hypothetical protein
MLIYDACWICREHGAVTLAHLLASKKESARVALDEWESSSTLRPLSVLHDPVAIALV